MDTLLKCEAKGIKMTEIPQRPKTQAEKLTKLMRLHVQANCEKAGCRSDMARYKKNVIKYGLLTFLCAVAAIAFAEKNKEICCLLTLFASLLPAYKIIDSANDYWERRKMLHRIERAQRR